MDAIAEANEYLKSAASDAQGVLWYESDILMERILTALEYSLGNNKNLLTHIERQGEVVERAKKLAGYDFSVYDEDVDYSARKLNEALNNLNNGGEDVK